MPFYPSYTPNGGAVGAARHRKDGEKPGLLILARPASRGKPPCLKEAKLEVDLGM